jgi:hypothetical protein
VRSPSRSTSPDRLSRDAAFRRGTIVAAATTPDHATRLAPFFDRARRLGHRPFARFNRAIQQLLSHHSQIIAQTHRTVRLTMLAMQRLDLRQQSVDTILTNARLTAQSLLVLFTDEAVSHRASLAKKAIAFFLRFRASLKGRFFDFCNQ